VRGSAAAQGKFGGLLEPLLLLNIKRAGRSTLASFKYLVENGSPDSGAARTILPIRSSC
jgi:hypothetical protein